MSAEERPIEGSPERARPRAYRSDLVLVATLTLASAVLLDAGVVCSNDGANYALVRALADGTTQIDAYREYTLMLDYSMRDEHYYSPRAPGTAFLLLPFFFAGRLFSGENDFLEVAAGLGSAAFAVALACLLYLASLRLGFSRAASVLASLALSLGTPLRSYASGMWSHVIVAFFALALVMLAHRALSEKRESLGPPLGLGALSACVVSADYSGVLYCVVVLVIVGIERARMTGVQQSFVRWIVPIVVGGLVTMAPTLIYHQIAFGSPFRTGYDFVVGEYAIVHHMSGMYGGNFFVGLGGLLFHPNAGLFLYSPVLAIGLFYGRDYLGRLPTRGLALLYTLPAVAMIVLTSFYTWWDGGGVHDVRFITQSLPLIGLPVAAAADRTLTNGGPRRPAAAMLFSVLFAASLLAQVIKHHAYWVRDGSVWLTRFGAAGDHIGAVLVSFAGWCWPHPVAALAILVLGLGLAAALQRTERDEPNAAPARP